MWKIILNNNLAINLLLLLILILLCFRSKYMKLNSNYLSKNNTDIIKGLSVIVVIFCHIAMFSVNDSIFKTIFLNSGILAVAIFLFVSGYGLMVQYLTKENYLKGFWKKIFNLSLIFVICNIVTTIINNLFLGTDYGVKDILISSLKFQFANGRELWFVFCILFMYIGFYISFKLLKRKGIFGVILSTVVYIFLCILIGKGYWWHNTVFCFLLGIIFAMYKDKILNFYKKNYYLKLILMCLIFLVTMFLYIKGYNVVQFIISIIFIILTTLILVKIELKSRILLYINKISFEMYLTHLVILQVAFQESVARNSIYLVILFPIMILLSVIVQWICKIMLKIFRLA